MNEIKPLYIFRSGQHTDQNGTRLTFTEADLAACALGYDPGKHEAPLVIGHPVTNAPAWGWVKQLQCVDGKLLATPDQLDPVFVEMIQNGRFKKLSAAFYLPNSPANPTPGSLYLRHLGFLGAQPPALKGLDNAAFGACGAGEVILEAIEPIFSSSTQGYASMTDLTPIPPEAAYAEREKKLQEAEAAFAEREKRLREAEAAAIAKADASFVEGLVKAGTLLPRHQAGMTALLAGMHETELVSYAEEGKKVETPSKAWLKSFLESLPNQVLFGEIAHPANDTPPARIDLPPGFMVDQSRDELYRHAMAYAEERKMDFITAARAIEKGAKA